MTFSMMSVSQTIHVHHFRADTGELIDSGDVVIPAHTGLPACSTQLAPPEAKTGFVTVFKDGAWSSLEDLRGQTAYSIVTGMPTLITEPGPLPEDSTLIAPKSAFDKWNGRAWKGDPDAEQAAIIANQKSHKTSLMQNANEVIAPLQDAVELDVATDEEKQRLLGWKTYRIALSRIDAADGEQISWPPLPE